VFQCHNASSHHLQKHSPINIKILFFVQYESHEIFKLAFKFVSKGAIVYIVCVKIDTMFIKLASVVTWGISVCETHRCETSLKLTL